MSCLLPRRLLLIFFGLAFLCSVAVAADLSGCRGAQKGAAALSPSLMRDRFTRYVTYFHLIPGN